MLPEHLEYYVGIFLLFSLGGIFLKWRGKRKKKKTSSSSLVIGLEKTHHSFTEKFKALLQLRPQIDEEIYAQLEEILIGADVGVKTTQKLLQGIREDAAKQPSDINQLKDYLQKEILEILEKPNQVSAVYSPHVTMVVGVNGVGKTTSIAKLTAFYHRQDQKVLLAAADTFRAGAVDQLKVWGERIGVVVLAQKEGADPASVAFDAVKAGEARGVDQIIIDTAGRLHTKINLMEELKKVHRVIDKAMPGAPHEILLVVDATQGQNALQQAREFHQALGLTGILLTKLDGTAKGGIVIGIVDELGVPIRYLGLGEKLEDLQHFSAKEFVSALLE